MVDDSLLSLLQLRPLLVLENMGRRASPETLLD